MTNSATDRRDPNNISEYLRVEWEDVIGEPEGTKSVACVWKNSRTIFRGTKNCCYKALTIFCGFPLAFIVGISFACLSFQHIWCTGPALGHCRAVCHVIKQYVRAILDACFAPCCSDMGLMCSRIRIRFNDSDTAADYVSGTGSLSIKPATALERMKMGARDHHPATVEEVI